MGGGRFSNDRRKHKTEEFSHIVLRRPKFRWQHLLEALSTTRAHWDDAQSERGDGGRGAPGQDLTIDTQRKTKCLHLSHTHTQHTQTHTHTYTQLSVENVDTLRELMSELMFVEIEALPHHLISFSLRGCLIGSTALCAPGTCDWDDSSLCSRDL